MIIIGDVPVAKSRFEKSLFDKKGFAFYQQICETAHKYGCKVCAQLHQTDTDMMSIIKCIPGMLMKKITPDQLRERMNDAVGPYITKMSQKKIHQIIAGFGKAAVLAKQAGFDMVQVHGDRMCGSFSSAIFNHRTDEYGGSAERRARFAVEAVKAVHAAVPGMAIDYKLLSGRRTPITQRRCGGGGTGRVRAPAGAGRRDQLPCDTGQPLCAGKHHPAGQPPRVQGDRLLPQVLR